MFHGKDTMIQFGGLGSFPTSQPAALGSLAALLLCFLFPLIGCGSLVVMVRVSVFILAKLLPCAAGYKLLPTI
jgi:hypothetical protein